jgi:hypothetical protein
VNPHDQNSKRSVEHIIISTKTKANKTSQRKCVASQEK